MSVYLHEITVEAAAIDENGHVNNVEYLRWMQDAATAHADSTGCTAAGVAAGCTWFARSHHIEYLKPALAGDRLVIRTWVGDMRRAASIRRYEVIRAADGAILARGETDWVYVDVASGKPRAIPEEIRDMFVIGGSANGPTEESL